MSPRASTDRLLGDVEINADVERHTDICDQDPDSSRRKEVEERLLWKLDLRLLFLILVIIMSQVLSPFLCRLSGTTDIAFQVDRNNIA